MTRFESYNLVSIYRARTITPDNSFEHTHQMDSYRTVRNTVKKWIGLELWTASLKIWDPQAY